MSGYSDFVTAITDLMGGYTIVDAATATPTDDTDFNNILPQIIAYAEGRIYRDPDFDFLTTRAAPTATCTLNSRSATKPTSLIVVEAVNVITPAGSNPDAASTTRTPLERVTLAFLDAVWNTTYSVTGATGVPKQYAPLTDTAFKLGPAPGAAYVLEFIGTTRPAALSSSNASTYLTTNLPDLFLACAMIFASGFMKNFGAQADNPQMAQSWEQQFQTLKVGAAVEEARKKSQGAAWSAEPPAAVASPPRS